MAERTTITQVVNIGVEALGASGTPVAATRRLQSLSIDPSIQTEIGMFRPSGFKFPTVQALNQEWTEANIEGQPTYAEVLYPLASVLTNPVTTGSAATGYTHTFSPATSAEDTPRTFTVDKGSSVRANRFSNGLVTDLSLSFARDGNSLDGTMIGKVLTDGITMEAAPTSLPLVPILPGQVSVYLDDTSAALGTTKLLRAVEVELSISSRYNPLWVLDAAQASWATHLEVEPTVEATLKLEADSIGMELLTDMRNGGTVFLRVEALGGDITGTTGVVPYQFRFDMAGKVSDPGDFDDEDGMYGIEWTLRGTHDATYGRALQVVVMNEVAAL